MLVVPFWVAGFAASLEASVVVLAPNRLALVGAADVVGVAVVGVAWACVVAAVPKRAPAGFVSVVALTPPPNRAPAVVAATGAAVDAAVVVGFAPNKPPAAAVAGVDVAGAEVVTAPPKRPPAGAEPGAEVAGAAVLAPNRVAAPEPAAACVEGVAWVVVAAVFAPPNRPPEAGAVVAAGLPPKSPPEAGAVLVWAPPKRPDDVGAVVLGWAARAAGLAPPPKRLDTAGDCAVVFWNKLDPAGFAEPAGGAPAGVVDARENMGFAGVAAVAGIAPCAVAELAALFPNKPLPVLAKRPAAGAAEVVAAP